MKTNILAVALVLLLSSCLATPQEWNIVRDVSVRVAEGDTVVLAGHSLSEYWVFVRGTSHVDNISVFLEVWESEDSLKSRVEMFNGSIESDEKRCGRVFLRDGDLSGAVLLVERLFPSGGRTESTSYSVRDLLIQGRSRGQPGATDNPDDAQRLREDH